MDLILAITLPILARLGNPVSSLLQWHPKYEGFIRVAKKKYKVLKEMGTFQMVSKQNGSYIIPLTWVFDYKFDYNRYLTRYKAQIWIQGDL